MKTAFLKAAIVAMAGAGAGTALAQETSENRVDANTDWSVFEAANPRECWTVSAPTSVRNTRDGEEVEVRRGDIILMVFERPGENISGQVAFLGGYPFANDSTVQLAIGEVEYELYPGESGPAAEWAWPANPEADAEIIDAMKAGAQAVLTARSNRGTVTQDTFSLLGFTASVNESARRCAG